MPVQCPHAINKIVGQAKFVCKHLGVGVPRLGKVQVVYRILMGAGARRLAHGLLIIANTHGARVVGEANTLSRCGVSVTGPRYALRGKLFFNT
jgi:hypothetical protein